MLKANIRVNSTKNTMYMDKVLSAISSETFMTVLLFRTNEMVIVRMIFEVLLAYN